ncbi:peptide/nickel transport system substrate-binding protein [Lacrimispora xylanisolvens]|uniref:Peptide/nickel transport system substrate-binding protein n=1 Tax=Lacrimispora xylanisolvens TaxID=384636 RepID=A0A2S6HM50_9FIRM|nr:ABC transporter substrate-binding protein [Hungatella xylanolytica]MBE5987626.1 ABC transporter substrate-binding protein [Paenibacillaceae bacterium]PPK78536.1 peptide/nickel transport system substrate-binding protein [Hungatella xylanolytica]
MRKRFNKWSALLTAGAMTMTLLSGCQKAASTDGTGQTSKAEETTQTTAQTTTAEEKKDSADAGSTPRNETLYFNGQQWGTINDWNPLSSNSNNAMAITQNDNARVIVYETLFMYNMLDGKLYGLLGKDYSWNDGQTELTITLNPDAKWSDQTPVTAQDVAYTFDCHKKYASAQGSDYSNYIDSVVAKDDHTVIFKAKLDDKGLPVNPLKVVEYVPKIYVMQKAYLQKVEQRNGNDADKIKQDRMDDFVASGPYKSYYNDDQKVVFVRDDNYWGKALWGKLPAPKYLTHVIYENNAAGDTAFKSGEVDVSQQFITNVQKLWEEDGLPISTYIDEAPYGVCATMPTAFFNVEKPGLDRKEVRKAIAMAVDYDQIIASAMSNQSPSFKDVPRSIMNPTSGEQALVNQEALKDYQFTGNDVEGAKALLDKAGIVDKDGDGIREIDGKNLTFKAECPDGWTDWNASLEIVAAAGSKIGIGIETYFPDANTFYDDMTTRKFDICMWNPPAASVANPWGRAMAFMSTDYANLKVNWTGNYGGYINEDANNLLKKIPLETNKDTLKEYYTELSRIYLDEVPSFSLMYRPMLFHAVNESVWTGFPQLDDGDNIPPTDCTDGYGIAALYKLVNVK